MESFHETTATDQTVKVPRSCNNMAKDPQFIKPPSHYQEPKRCNRIQATNQYEEIGEVNLCALYEMNYTPSSGRKMPVKTIHNLSKGMHSNTNTLPKDAFLTPRRGSHNIKQRSCCFTVATVVFMVISLTSLALNVLVIKGVIVTPGCSKRVSNVPTTVPTKPGIIQAFRGVNEEELRSILISLIKNVSASTVKPGPTGPRGPPGLQGIKGNPGISGSSGSSGSPGSLGHRGPMGQTGAKGERGLPGLKGNQGVKGLQGLRGVPGLNGSNGESGVPGPPGSGNLSACLYKTDVKSTGDDQNSQIKDLIVNEPTGKTFLGVSCSTNLAATSELSSGIKNGVRWFKCFCAGTIKTLLPLSITSSTKLMTCRIHYWDCPSLS